MIVTARQRSCRILMFSLAFVCSQEDGVTTQRGEYLGVSTQGVSTWGTPRHGTCQEGVSTQGMGTHPRHGTCKGGSYSPLLLTPSGSHKNMYGWQAGSTHPTVMLSRYIK